MDSSKVLERIRNAQRLWVAGHIGPDGDSITSALLMGRLLHHLKKKYAIYMRDKVPEKFSFLADISQVRRELPTFSPDVLVSVDSPNLSRIALENFTRDNPDATIINIDHHQSNENFGDMNWLQTERSAACLMVLELLRLAGVPVGSKEGQMVFTGLFTETGGFVFPNASEEVFEVCAEVVKLGVDTSEVALKMTARDEPNLSLLGEILSSLVVKDGIATIERTQDMLSASGLNQDEEDSDSYIRYAMSIPGIKVTIFFREMREDSVVRLSFRSLAGVDVNKLAAKFGGGGHPAAAGALIEGDYEKVKQIVLTETKAYLRQVRD